MPTKDKDKIRAKNKRYRDAHREELKLYNKLYEKKRDKLKKAGYQQKWKAKNSQYALELSKLANNKGRIELDDGYIIRQLIAKGFEKENITTELIDVQRLIIKTKRLCKTLETSEKV